MSSEKELLTAFVSKTLNLDESGVASLYNEDGSELKPDALDLLLSKDQERVKSLKPDTKRYFDDGYKKAQSESLSKFEKELQDKFGVKSEKKGIELISDIVTTQLKANGTEMTEDAIKKHPIYITTVEKLQSEAEERVRQEAEKLSQFQSEIKRKETFSEIEKKALAAFHGMKPVLSKDETKAANQQRILLNELGQFEYDLQGDKIVILKDGKVLEDEHGYPVKFEKIVKAVADKYYDFQVSDPKSAPGNGKPAPNGQAAEFKFDVPKSDAEYMKMMNNSEFTVEQRAQIKEAYRKQQS